MPCYIHEINEAVSPLFLSLLKKIERKEYLPALATYLQSSSAQICYEVTCCANYCETSWRGVRCLSGLECA